MASQHGRANKDDNHHEIYFGRRGIFVVTLAFKNLVNTCGQGERSSFSYWNNSNLVEHDIGKTTNEQVKGNQDCLGAAVKVIVVADILWDERFCSEVNALFKDFKK